MYVCAHFVYYCMYNMYITMLFVGLGVCYRLDTHSTSEMDQLCWFIT